MSRFNGWVVTGGEVRKARKNGGESWALPYVTVPVPTTFPCRAAPSLIHSPSPHRLARKLQAYRHLPAMIFAPSQEPQNPEMRCRQMIVDDAQQTGY